MLLYVLTAALLCASSIRAQQSITFSAPDTLNTVGCTGGNSWTKWFNEMKPTATQMDEETHTTLVSKYGRDVCAKHNGIQAQSVGPLAAGVSYSGSWKTMNNVITAFTSATAGLDFQVRFCCANTDFTPTTTTTTTPRPLPNASCGRAEIKASLQTSRIFGGSLAVANSWPWQVLYQETKACGTNQICTGNCGGTLLSPNFVLTAAHCVGTTNGASISITAGVNDKQIAEAGTRQTSVVKKITMHPGWDSKLLKDDLAILELATPFKYNKFVQPACLPGPDPRVNSSVVLIGWGAEVMGSSVVPKLKQTLMTVVGDCFRYWGQIDESKQICVASRAAGDSACQGDSGGPMLQSSNGQWVVQGVASFVSDCKTSGELPPNVYVRVSAYLPWIKSITGV